MTLRSCFLFWWNWRHSALRNMRPLKWLKRPPLLISCPKISWNTSFVIALGVGDVTYSPLVSFDRLNVTFLKYQEAFLHWLVFNSGASGFVPHPLASHLFYNFFFLTLPPLIDSEGYTEFSLVLLSSGKYARHFLLAPIFAWICLIC